MTAHDFLAASALIRLLAVPQELKAPFYLASIARYEALYTNSPRRHDCPFCRQLLRRHVQDWRPARAHAQQLLTELQAAAPGHRACQQLQTIIDIGDEFAGSTDETTNTD